jgi:hypothetical protein
MRNPEREKRKEEKIAPVICNLCSNLVSELSVWSKKKSHSSIFLFSIGQRYFYFTMYEFPQGSGVLVSGDIISKALGEEARDFGQI